MTIKQEDKMSRAKINLVPFLLATSLLVACNGGGSSSASIDTSSLLIDPPVTMKTISKEDYYKKTLGGALGQIAGFLSGYEFVWDGPDPYVGMPQSWFSFINGPYAGNYEHYQPGILATPDYQNVYNRLIYNASTGHYEVANDDDYHIDFFNQLIIDHYGVSAKAIHDAWLDYSVSDWGGGLDAMKLIRQKDLLPPFTGTIEAGNRYAWCTEAYIENETLGMNAPGMPNLATDLIDTFASNVGYLDPVIWAKFYGAMYSLAYFYDSSLQVMEEAAKVLPENSWPYRMYQYSLAAYQKYPQDYRLAASEVASYRRNILGIDNIQTDPGVNGAFAILSLLYGQNDYLETCKYASIMGFDGDCTAAIVTGLMGIIKGFDASNPEYEEINNRIYYNGEGTYLNLRNGNYPPYINGEYPERQLITDIVSLYQKNFEKLLLENGGQINGDNYLVPTTSVRLDRSKLFLNYDVEDRTTSNFVGNNGTLSLIEEGTNSLSHSGYRALKLMADDGNEDAYAYHVYTGLNVGSYYRVSAFIASSNQAAGALVAMNKTNDIAAEEDFYNITSPINKVLVFKASDSTMRIGIRLDRNTPLDGFVVMDDLMMEMVSQSEIATIREGSMQKFLNKYTFSFTSPIKGKEVIIALNYRNGTDNIIYANIASNGVSQGSFVLSKTSKDNNSGQGTVNIPYVFSEDQETITLSFIGSSIYMGKISVIEKEQYMFR
jgi:hypothetical protein